MQFINVVEELCVRAMEGVVLQDDVFCQACSCWAYAACRREVSLACCLAFLKVAHFENSPIHLSHESVAQLLCHL